MELMTEEIKENLPPLYSTEGTPSTEKVCVVKYFQPWGSWTWYAIEFDGKDTFFGLVDGFELEWGNFSLSELQSIKGPFGLAIERDLYFGTPKMEDIPALKGRVGEWCLEV